MSVTGVPAKNADVQPSRPPGELETAPGERAPGILWCAQKQEVPEDDRKGPFCSQTLRTLSFLLTIWPGRTMMQETNGSNVLTK